ncbi:N-alpha-acetyltransferase 35: NatC auxiliary subunit-like protein [Dinothrombium tinctorium]|uniref:Protein MAK10 homolog n=1 Tax=Dinothrombium tinctorium TaxID=1965070 RepID=A0A443RS29_9ACAR|nr:N-alpha-acetyltransferase 35: NatC auxiliary subunit-like protein [Dinothrombium tinctorium]
MEKNCESIANDTKFNWKEVTNEFIAATGELKLGELLHDEMFGLFEAMSAIEMMDPKMDAGMLCNRSKKVLNFDQALACGKLKVNNLTIEEQIGIIDDTCGCLITWLEGHSLAQTVFTNLYLHNPNAVEDKCIRAFSVVVLKLVAIVKDFVTKANVVEEEDIQPLYGFVMPCDYSDNKACAMIRDVEEEVQRKLKAIQKDSTKQNCSENDSEKYFQQENEQQLLLALYVRLKFFRLFFQSLILLKKEIFNKVQYKKLVVSANVEDIEKHLQQSSETFQFWQQTLSMGVQPDTNSDPDAHGDYPTIMGFEPLVNQRLLPPTFPRRVLMRTRKEAVNYIECLVSRLRHVCKVYDCSTFHSALDFFTDFSKSSSPSSCVLSRSILQLLYLPAPGLVFGVQPLSELLRETVRQFIKPPSLQTKSQIFANNSQAKEYIEVFFNHCARPMTSLLQISGHNRARQREKLAQALEELATLQDEAEKLDSFLNNISQKLDTPLSHMGYFSTWILYHILRVMIQYLLSGFELELYSTHEYPYIFWYLYEFLYGWMVSTLNRASNLIQEQESQNDQKGRGSKKSKAKKRKQKPHFRETLLNQAFQQLCGGYYKTVCAFKLQGKLKLPKAALNTDQIRHEHRFAAFNSVIAPPPVSYNQYKDMTEQMSLANRQNPNELYATACKCFQQAKILFENIPEPNEEICSCMKIAKTNYVVIKLLLSGHIGELKTYPEFDFSVDKVFPIIRIL